MLSNYEIEKQLGKGTYGVVYKVKKRDDNKIYVLKQISLLGLTDSQKDEVKLEAKVLSKIKSKYVVKYYDSFEEDAKLNIIMEYCDNGDLNDFLERHKLTKHLLPENLVWKIFIKITLGMADIHKLKILHRDLKSLNIFLKKDDDIRVGDLGVAKILNQTFFAKTFIGTPYYLSPEICEDKPYNDKSDVWALGCILYELCTYQHPFTAKSQGGLILKILNDNPKPIHSYYSKDLSNLLNLIFDKDYKKRPSCLDILKMKFVIDKAKSLDIFEDIKSSFPDIENNNEKLDIINNKVKSENILKIKPVIMKNNNNKNEPRKRPASGFGLFGRKGINNKKIKFNEIGFNKKKNENAKVLCIEKNDNIKKKGHINKNIKIIKRDKNSGKNNIPSKPIRKKAIVSPKKKGKENDKNLLFKAAELFEQKRQVKKIYITDIKNQQNDKIIKDNISIFGTKDLNNLVNNDTMHSVFNSNNDNASHINNNNNNNNNNEDINKNPFQQSIYNNDDINKNTSQQQSIYNTKELNQIFINKDQSIFNEVKNNNENNNNVDNNNNNNNEIIDTRVDIKKFNYTRDSVKDSFMEQTKDKNIENEVIKELTEENKNNSSIESDIYMTAKRDQYQPKKIEEEDKKEKENVPKKEIEIKNEKEIKKDELKDTGSSLNFTEMISDFTKDIETSVNSNYNNKLDFQVIVNNEEEPKINKNLDNVDNNISISDVSEEDDDKKNYSNDDKYEDNEEEEENEKEIVKEINTEMEKDGNKKNIDNEEFNDLKNRIDKLKKEIPKLIGEKNYKYIREICSTGIEGKNQEEVTEKIEKFIKENSNNNNKDKFYDVMKLFLLECQYYKMQKSS